MRPSENQLLELQKVISKMTLGACCVCALPELGVRWKNVSRAIRKNRLPMTPASIATIIHRHVASEFTQEEMLNIVARLKLKLVATQIRTWYVINLLEPVSDEPVMEFLKDLPSRLIVALRKSKNGRNMRLEVQTVMMGDLLYTSIRLVSAARHSSPLYAATPPGQPVVLVNSPQSGLLKILAQGLGYEKYEDACLNGRDVASLLRIHNQGYTEHAAQLSGPLEYQPMPVMSANGVDYTNRTYDERYVQELIGPNPPLLTNLSVKICKPFFDNRRLNKKMKMKMELRSEDIAAALTACASRGALAPTSDLFQILHKTKSNKITYNDESE